MTEQLKILTKMRVMGEIYEEKGKKYLTNDVNPFFKSTKKTVSNNWEYAKECYKKVFLRFANTHFTLYGRLPPKEWINLEI